jgi:MoxR-like ATPase
MQEDPAPSEHEDLYASRIALGDLREAMDSIRREVRKLVVGQADMVDLLLAALLADGHVLIEGVPGVAKTLTAKILSRIVSVPFSRIQFTPDLMPSDVLGTSIFSLKTSEFEFRKGPIFANFVLIDEINRAPAKTQAALFEVMEERQVSIDGHVFRMAPPFIVLATQNPIEQEGTYRLPEAQLDRFLFKIEVGYPTLEQEAQLLQGLQDRRLRNDLSAIQPVLSAERLAAFRAQVAEVRVEPEMISYIAKIVDKTRHHQALYLGGSPRASVAILATAKAAAAMQGRDFATPDDVKRMAVPVLRHRLMLSPEKEMEGVRVDDVIREVVESVEVPR